MLYYLHFVTDSNQEIAAEMAATSDPAKHKSLGRQARGFDRAKWDENKLRIVEEGTWFKFTASKNAAEVKKQLLETGDREIVEVSWAEVDCKTILTMIRPHHWTRSGELASGRRMLKQTARSGARTCSVLLS